MGYGVNKKDFWRASSVAFGDIYRREINYCGLASMSWMYYYDAENGLYIGSHDARFPVTGVIAETAEAPKIRGGLWLPQALPRPSRGKL